MKFDYQFEISHKGKWDYQFKEESTSFCMVNVDTCLNISKQCIYMASDREYFLLFSSFLRNILLLEKLFDIILIIFYVIFMKYLKYNGYCILLELLCWYRWLKKLSPDNMNKVKFAVHQDYCIFSFALSGIVLIIIRQPH